MRIYSNTLKRQDLYDALRGIEDVHVDYDGVQDFTPRAGGSGFLVYLEGAGDRHRRARNGRDGHAATWDDYGVWISRLYEIDPSARIGHYNDVIDFYRITRQYIPRGCKAPWLAYPASRILWPSAKQRAEDKALIDRTRRAEVLREARSLRAQADKLEASL